MPQPSSPPPHQPDYLRVLRARLRAVRTWLAGGWARLLACWQRLWRERVAPFWQRLWRERVAPFWQRLWRERVAPFWQQRLAPLRPYALTALVAVVLVLLLQAALGAGSAERLTARTVATVQALPPPSPVPTIPPTPPPVLPTADPTRAELEALRSEVNRLWSAYYLARSASQLADAEAALRVNDLDEVEQVLTTVGASLDRAYERSPEQEKGPISEFRLQVGTMREEVRIRPQGMDRRLRRLRQSMLNLVDEGG